MLAGTLAPCCTARVNRLAGAVVRFGEETGVAMPMNRAIYGALKVHDLKARGELVVR